MPRVGTHKIFLQFSPAQAKREETLDDSQENQIHESAREFQPNESEFELSATLILVWPGLYSKISFSLCSLLISKYILFCISDSHLMSQFNCSISQLSSLILESCTLLSKELFVRLKLLLFLIQLRVTLENNQKLKRQYSLPLTREPFASHLWL